MVPTPSVAITEFTLSLVTMRPLTTPISAPSPSTIAIASAIGSLVCTIRPVTSTPCRLAA